MQHKASVLPRHPSHNSYCGGVVNWRTAIVHYVAKAVGLLVKVEGMPLGSDRNLERVSHGIANPMYCAQAVDNIAN